MLLTTAVPIDQSRLSFAPTLFITSRRDFS